MARRTTWGWWDEWDDTSLKTHDSKIDPRRSEAEHATARSRRLPPIFILYEWAEKKHFCFIETLRPEMYPRSPTFQSGSFNHCTRTPAPYWERDSHKPISQTYHFWHIRTWHWLPQLMGKHQFIFIFIFSILNVVVLIRSAVSFKIPLHIWVSTNI